MTQLRIVATDTDSGCGIASVKILNKHNNISIDAGEWQLFLRTLNSIVTRFIQ